MKKSLIALSLVVAASSALATGIVKGVTSSDGSWTLKPLQGPKIVASSQDPVEVVITVSPSSSIGPIVDPVYVNCNTLAPTLVQAGGIYRCHIGDARTGKGGYVTVTDAGNNGSSGAAAFVNN